MKIGQKVEHVLNKEYLLILEIGDDFIKCRTKDMREIYFFAFELRELK